MFFIESYSIIIHFHLKLSCHMLLIVIILDSTSLTCTLPTIIEFQLSDGICTGHYLLDIAQTTSLKQTSIIILIYIYYVNNIIYMHVNELCHISFT